MGANLSQPRTNVPAVPSKQPLARRINSRTVMAPAAAFTMALILFVYTRTSIRAAKANAQRHRDADTGGEGLSLLNESRRRHGLEGKVEGSGGGIVRELGRELVGSGKKEGKRDERRGSNEEEERRRALREAARRKSSGGGSDAGE